MNLGTFIADFELALTTSTSCLPGGESDSVVIEEDVYMGEDDVIIEDDFEGEDADSCRIQEEEEEETEEYDPISDSTMPVLLARFKVGSTPSRRWYVSVDDSGNIGWVRDTSPDECM